MFPRGQTTQLANVSVVSDLIVEPHETFEVQLRGPAKATLGVASAPVTVVEDDSPLVSGSLGGGALAVDLRGTIA